MATRTLWDEQNACKDCNAKNCGSKRAAKCQAAVIERFVKEVANGRAQWTGQNECGPEQQNAAYPFPEIERRQHRQHYAKDYGCTCIAKTTCVGSPITKSRA